MKKAAQFLSHEDIKKRGRSMTAQQIHIRRSMYCAPASFLLHQRLFKQHREILYVGYDASGGKAAAVGELLEQIFQENVILGGNGLLFACIADGDGDFVHNISSSVSTPQGGGI